MTAPGICASKYVMVMVCVMLAGCSEQNNPSPASETPLSGDVTRTRVVEDADPGNWYTTGRTFEESHYSPLTQINKETVQQVGFAWEYDTKTTRGLEATPVVIDGIMFTSGTWGRVYALDAGTGKALWTFNPEVDGQVAGDACCDVVNRGVAVWKGRVYVAALDGRLIALDAATGEKAWEVDTITEHQRRYTVTGAPRVAGNVVVIGNSGAEFDARGYISAYDVDSGELVWRFYTVPGSPDKPREHPELEMAAETWDPDSRWDVGGGGTVWDGMAYDPDLNILYVGTGNSAPYAISIRSPQGGDNLFLSSILAINPDSGRLIWHYQTTPGDSWDYTATQNLILADIELEGRMRKVIMQAPKNGFFYLLDRETGELLGAEPFVPVNWATHVDMETGRPAFTDAADYFTEPKMQWPADAGGHNWYPMAFNPDTDLVYIPTWEFAWLRVNLHPAGDYVFAPGEITMGVLNFPPLDAVVEQYAPFTPYTADYLKDVVRNTDFPPAREVLKAWNPKTQSVVWEVESDNVFSAGGVLTTGGGLVVQGHATGLLYFYDADTGELLHSIDTGTGIMAGPVTYTVEGQQYIAVMAGLGGASHWALAPHSAAYTRGNAGRILAFKLGGGQVPLPPVLDPEPFPEPPALSTMTGNPEKGALLFGKNCSFCHANSDRNLLPDLRKLSREKHQIFEEIVLRGALRARGMPQFDALFSEADVKDIQTYLVAEAWAGYLAQEQTEQGL